MRVESPNRKFETPNKTLRRKSTKIQNDQKI